MSFRIAALSRTLQTIATVALVTLPPLLGLVLAGQRVDEYLAFPPRPSRLDMPGFYWPMFVFYALAILVVATPFLRRLAQSAGTRVPPPTCNFPVWGWLGVGLLAASWSLAWGLLPAPTAMRQHSFAPLWLGYVVIVQALTWRRVGRCLMLAQPLRFVALFPASAAFWWLFEYLNRFVGNWIYQGGESMSAMAYLLAATVPFSTVLPAVLSTRDLLATFPPLYRSFEHWWRPPRLSPRVGAAALLLAFVPTLAILGLFPNWLFALLWLAPLGVMTAVQTLADDQHVFSRLPRGDWSGVWLAALASLVCGFFWEFWNWHSFSRWTYDIPFVERFHLFEMPLLGYAGYLPFGLACMAAAHMLTGLSMKPITLIE